MIITKFVFRNVPLCRAVQCSTLLAEIYWSSFNIIIDVQVFVWRLAGLTVKTGSFCQWRLPVSPSEPISTLACSRTESRYYIKDVSKRRMQSIYAVVFT